MGDDAMISHAPKRKSSSKAKEVYADADFPIAYQEVPLQHNFPDGVRALVVRDASSVCYAASAFSPSDRELAVRADAARMQVLGFTTALYTFDGATVLAKSLVTRGRHTIPSHVISDPTSISMADGDGFVCVHAKGEADSSAFDNDVLHRDWDRIVFWLNDSDAFGNAAVLDELAPRLNLDRLTACSSDRESACSRCSTTKPHGWPAAALRGG